MVLFCGLKAEFFSITNQELRIVKRKRRINMVEKVYPMTLEGKEKLEQELEELKTIKRKGIHNRRKCRSRSIFW